MVSGKLLNSARRSAGFSVMTQMGGMRGGGMGALEEGDVCIRMTNLLC